MLIEKSEEIYAEAEIERNFEIQRIAAEQEYDVNVDIKTDDETQHKLIQSPSQNNRFGRKGLLMSGE